MSPQREANVVYASGLLETEIGQRNARKDSQEATARWLVASAGLVMTLLLGLAKDEGIFSSAGYAVGRVAFVATIALGGVTAVCAIRCLWPRKYERLGEKGLKNLNDPAFLDRPQHEVVGRVVASRIDIVKTMNELHENKATWLKWSFRFFVCALVGLVVQGAVLAARAPSSPSGRSSTLNGAREGRIRGRSMSTGIALVLHDVESLRMAAASTAYPPLPTEPFEQKASALPFVFAESKPAPAKPASNPKPAPNPTPAYEPLPNEGDTREAKPGEYK